MSEIKQKLNIRKITLKNVFLLVLLMLAMLIIGAIGKIMGKNSNITGAKAAQAACWTPPPVGIGACCEGCTSGESGECCGSGA
jgi:hypothetical protein